MITKSLLISLTLCYLLCRGLESWSCILRFYVDFVILLQRFFYGRFLMESETRHIVKVGTQSFVLEPRNKSLVFVIAFPLTLLYLLLLTLVFQLSLHLLLIYCIISACRFSLTQSRRQLSPSIYYLEEYRGEILDPFIRNPDSNFDLS